MFYTCFYRIGNGKDKIILVGKNPNPIITAQQINIFMHLPLQDPKKRP